MKREFQVLRDRPMLKIRVTRDSVCAGDDVDAPNERFVEVHSFTEPDAFIQAVTTAYGMPLIEGGKAAWVVLLNGEKIGVAAQEWDAPVASARELRFQKSNHVFLRYHAQTEPSTL
ncbi:hypothetical protein OAF27_03395 [Verrucomicrobiales bacterium]|nr:hypothetical protein [Verrucomicrobiales bacterium]